MAFYLGLAPDHLADLAVELAGAIGAPAPVRYGALGMFEGRASLVEACRQVFGEARFPFFDLAGADLVLSFGANFLETWLSPVAYTRGYSQFRRSTAEGKKRGYFVSFEARRSLTSGVADEWYPVTPGSEGLVALALGKLLADRGWTLPLDVSAVDVNAAAQAAGIPREKLEHLADLAARAEHPLFIPGGGTLGHVDGLAAARSVLALNLGAGALGQPGGIFLAPAAAESSSLLEVQALIERMRSGQVETLFIHGANPVFELPPALGFAQALENVKQVISFASYPDETAMLSDYLLPDHTPLESFGYQRTWPAPTARPTPACSRWSCRYTTPAPARTCSSRRAGCPTATRWIHPEQAGPLLNQSGGNVEAPEIATFWSRYLQFGGWWSLKQELASPAAQPTWQRPPLRLARWAKGSSTWSPSPPRWATAAAPTGPGCRKPPIHPPR